MRAVLLMSLLLLSASPLLRPAAPPGPAAGGQVKVNPPEDADERPVEVPPPSEEAVRYYQSGNVLWLVNVAWGVLVPCLFLFTGLSARLRDGARRVGRRWFFTIAFYFVFFAVVSYLINLPLAYYEGFVRPHQYGLSNQTLAKWFTDSLKSLGVVLVVGVLFFWVPYLLVRKSPRRWWLYTGLLALPFLFLGVIVEPIWIAPLFNHFGPMQDKHLEGKILALADRAGIEGARVYEVDKSVDTNQTNAYVTGFLSTKRIVLWDTLLAKLNDREVLFVMGHEMGHYVLGHVVQGMLCAWLLLLAGLYGVYRSAGPLLRRFHERFGFDRLEDVASWPLFLLLAALFSLVLTLPGLAFSRHLEHEADRFGLEITQDNHAAAMSFVKLQRDNLAVPWPGLLYKLWRGSHPSLGERITFCNEYQPWEKGEPLKYGALFRTPKPGRSEPTLPHE